MLLFNATNDEQAVKAFGNWFNFKSKQIKEIKDEIGKFIILDKKMYGIVALPEEMGDLEFRNSDEGKAILADKTKEGLSNHLAHLRRIVRNAEISVRSDLEKVNDKSDYRSHMTASERDALKKLVEYQSTEDDAAKKQIEEIKELERKLKR